jgi:hypothetical protein
MLKQVHDHITSELRQNARTDTIFVVTAIAFNLIVLGINSGVASEGASDYAESSSDLILVVFIIMSMIINSIAVTALNFGKKTRLKLIRGLLTMYEDNDVAKYYDESLLSAYGTRYILFIGVIISLALAGIIVPLIIRFV